MFKRKKGLSYILMLVVLFQLSFAAIGGLIDVGTLSAESNDALSGDYSASTSELSFEPVNAFDKDTTTCWKSTSSDTSPWLQASFQNKINLLNVSVTVRTIYDCEMYLQASNENSGTFTTISDTVKVAGGVTKMYSPKLKASQTYKYVKLVFVSSAKSNVYKVFEMNISGAVEKNPDMTVETLTIVNSKQNEQGIDTVLASGFEVTAKVSLSASGASTDIMPYLDVWEQSGGNKQSFAMFDKPQPLGSGASKNGTVKLGSYCLKSGSVYNYQARVGGNFSDVKNFKLMENLPSITPVPSQATPSVTPAASTPKFTDLESHWAKSYVELLASQKIITGFPDNTFRPNDNITRAQVCVMLAKAVGLQPVTNTTTKFYDDLSIPDWAKPYVIAAYQNNITNGYSDGTFKPNNLLTRQEMVTMLLKAFNIPVSQNANLSNFKDANSITWSKPYVAKAFELGIVSGYSDNYGDGVYYTFKPTNLVTRAEVCKMIVNAQQKTSK